MIMLARASTMYCRIMISLRRDGKTLINFEEIGLGDFSAAKHIFELNHLTLDSPISSEGLCKLFLYVYFMKIEPPAPSRY